MSILDIFRKKEVKTNETKSYEQALTKSRQNIVSKLMDLTNKYHDITEEYFEDLEEILITADVGINTVMKFIDVLKERIKNEKITSPKGIKEIIVDELFIIYVNNDIISDKINFNKMGPTVILFVGVNGAGKTTTIGKLANTFRKNGKSVLLVAGDTFRAGATAQLEEWAKRSDSMFIGRQDSDPASVIYEGMEKAVNEEIDVVLVDTAGRLQNKDNLMKELEKMNKVIGKHVSDAPHETLLVIDATTGQNGISQAKHFKEVTNITGVVLSKLDGTAKGGIVLAIKDSVELPVKYVGLGEGIDDLHKFDIEKYIYGLFKDML